MSIVIVGPGETFVYLILKHIKGKESSVLSKQEKIIKINEKNKPRTKESAETNANIPTLSKNVIFNYKNWVNATVFL